RLAEAGAAAPSASPSTAPGALLHATGPVGSGPDRIGHLVSPAAARSALVPTTALAALLAALVGSAITLVAPYATLLLNGCAVPLWARGGELLSRPSPLAVPLVELGRDQDELLLDPHGGRGVRGEPLRHGQRSVLVHVVGLDHHAAVRVQHHERALLGADGVGQPFPGAEQLERLGVLVAPLLGAVVLEPAHRAAGDHDRGLEHVIAGDGGRVAVDHPPVGEVDHRAAGVLIGDDGEGGG